LTDRHSRDRHKPDRWPGAVILRRRLRPRSHAAADVTAALHAWIGELHAGGYLAGYFIKHAVVSVDTRDGVPKGRRYSARLVLWPTPKPKKKLENSTR
jgi:hypothetical protein